MMSWRAGLANERAFNGSPRPRRNRGVGFTLVELLVVITIIGILVALLLPAVQSVREAGRRVQCINNIRSLAQGLNAHQEAYGFFPSAGWGWFWTGDPDRGTGKQQPGSWAYSVLPFIDQDSLWRQGADFQPDQITSGQKAGAGRATTTPLSIFNCPTRRRSKVYPQIIYTNWNCPLYNGDMMSVNNRADYKINGGTVKAMWGGGPAPAQGLAGQGFTDMSSFNGIAAQRSEIRIDDILDGPSQTYLVGEKYLNPDNYATGGDYCDDHSMFAGDDYDMQAWSDEAPAQDRAGDVHFWRWGSAHAEGFHVAFCDASARMMSFNLDPGTHKKLGSRNDGSAVDGSQY